MKKIKITKQKEKIEQKKSKEIKISKATRQEKSLKSLRGVRDNDGMVRNNGKKRKIEKDKSTLTVSVYDTNGKEIETIFLPEEMFKAKVNKILMAQAVRVYLANQRQGSASTKTRGEVTGSTRKIYRQKGTGRARHGGIRAPIFVHGGIAHGPKPQDHSLAMPKKMKKAALFSALTTKLVEQSVKIVSGLETLEPKTKIMANVLNHFGLADKKAKILLVTPENIETVTRAGRNLTGVTITSANRLNTYEVLNAKSLIFMKNSIQKMQEVFGKKE